MIPHLILASIESSNLSIYRS